MFIRIILLFSTPLIITAILSCSIAPYKVQVYQGNNIDNNHISKLTLGMSPVQVIKIVGTPDIQDAFSPNRFDYVYISKNADETYHREHYYLIFSNDKLTKISSMTKQAISMPPNLSKIANK
jgi:outer membrane protein assembly factor BamE